MLHELWALGNSPIKVGCLENILKNYPNKEVAYELLQGFKEGFKLNYNGPRVSVVTKNLRSARCHEKELLEKVHKEINKGRILGPFDEKPISNLRVNPVGIVPKKTGGWRLISHLSAPSGFSVNDFIDTQACSVSYSSFDSAV